jgi:hypothetical protein
VNSRLSYLNGTHKKVRLPKMLDNEEMGGEKTNYKLNGSAV